MKFHFTNKKGHRDCPMALCLFLRKTESATGRAWSVAPAPDHPGSYIRPFHHDAAFNRLDEVGQEGRGGSAPSGLKQWDPECPKHRVCVSYSKTPARCFQL